MNEKSKMKQKRGKRRQNMNDAIIEFYLMHIEIRVVKFGMNE
jgi:hypothetical protein